MARMPFRETRKRWARVAVRNFEVMARKISKTTREKWAEVAFHKYLVIFSYYRLYRRLLMLTKDFIGRKLTSTMISSSVRRMRIQVLAIKPSEIELDERRGIKSSRWSKQLPQEIMELILHERLGISDYIRCRAVCLSWREAVDMAIASKRCRPAPQLPLLMLCSDHFSLKDNSFLSLSDQRIYRSSPFSMNRLICLGSIEGWLIMVDNVRVHPEGFMKPWSYYLLHDYESCQRRFPTVNFFLNPLSGARVMLPSQSTIPCANSSNPNFFFSVTASSGPTSQHSSCLVASLLADGGLAFCRPNDKSWTLIHHREVVGRHFGAIEVLDGKLYAMTKYYPSRYLWVFDIQDGNVGGPSSYTVQRLVMLHPRPSYYRELSQTRDGIKYQSNVHIDYLSKDSASKELFMIRRRLSLAREVDPVIPWTVVIGDNFIVTPQTDEFQVFKLELNNGPRWVEIVDLLDRTLFISRTSCEFIPASIVPERNCIYFAFDHPCSLALPSSSRRDVGVFSLTNRTIHRHIFPEDDSRTRLDAQPVWFTPNYSLVA